MSDLTSFRWTRTLPLINRNREDVWIVPANYYPPLNVIDVIDCEEPYEPLLEESDDPPIRDLVMYLQFYLFRDLKSFSFQRKVFNVSNFL